MTVMGDSVNENKKPSRLPVPKPRSIKNVNENVEKTDTQSNGSKPVSRENGLRSREKLSPMENGHDPGKSKTLLKIRDSGGSGVDQEPAAEDGTDNINVVVRVRPLNQQELDRKDKQCMAFPGDGALQIDNQGSSTKAFTFNVTFEPEALQNDVFDHSGITKLIDMAINGYSCTCFAFGQTGSGKTHTITGPPDVLNSSNKMDHHKMGLIPRSFNYLFQQLDRRKNTSFTVHASYLEIYNEQVIDLLNPHQRKHLSVRWSKTQGFYVENLFVIECEHLDDLQAVLEEGLRNRQTSSHSMNDFSSRSHSILTLMIDSENPDPDDPNLYTTKHGKLTFVDLAGSEKVKDTNATGEALVESNNINRSLLVLGNCISALGDAKKRQGHIPYRDSKLTKLLADSLGGSGVTLMIACVSPSMYNVSESVNTLRYANRAKNIKNKPELKMDPHEKQIMTLKREVKTLRQENQYLRQQLDFPDKPRSQHDKDMDPRFQEWLKQQKNSTKKSPREKKDNKKKENKESKVVLHDDGLYEILQEYMIENEVLRSENSDLVSSQDRHRRDKQEIARENEKIAKRLEELERMGIATPLSIHSVSTIHSSAYPSRDISAYPSRDITPTNIYPRPSYESVNGYDAYNSHPAQQRVFQPRPTPPNDIAVMPAGRDLRNGYGNPSPPSQSRPGIAPPPQNLQHPRRPPHRLTEPMPARQSDRSPQRLPAGQGYANRYRHSNENLAPPRDLKHVSPTDTGYPVQDPRLLQSDPQGVLADPRVGGYVPQGYLPPHQTAHQTPPMYPGSAPDVKHYSLPANRQDKSALSEPAAYRPKLANTITGNNNTKKAGKKAGNKTKNITVNPSHTKSEEISHLNDKLREELSSLDNQIKYASGHR